MGKFIGRTFKPNDVVVGGRFCWEKPKTKSLPVPVVFEIFKKKDPNI